jgi:hypothetical protein
MRHLSDPIKQEEEKKTETSFKISIPLNQKTEIVRSQEEANSLFGITEVKETEKKIITQISFFEPTKDLEQSALLVAFVVSNECFFETLFDFQNENEVVKVSIKHCLNILDCVLHKPAKEELTRKTVINNFIANMQLLGFSISQIEDARSVLLMKQRMQNLMDVDESEQYIVEFETKFIPPNEIELKSPLLTFLPNTGDRGMRKLKLKWCLFERNSFIYPAIVEDDYEVAALYKSELFTRFGSISSCILSGSKLLYACYSTSNAVRPELVPYEK